MRTTLNIGDQFLEEAWRLTGVKEKTTLIREALKTLIEWESARRLARMGGTEPQWNPCSGEGAGSMIFLQGHSLTGRGIGYVDLHLLKPAALTEGACLWGLDKRLGTVARKLGLLFIAQ